MTTQFQKDYETIQDLITRMFHDENGPSFEEQAKAFFDIASAASYYARELRKAAPTKTSTRTRKQTRSF